MATEHRAEPQVPTLGRRLFRGAPLVLLAIGCVAQAWFALHLAADGWFGGDALHYLGSQGGLVKTDQGLLDPVAGHWVTTLVLVYRILFQMFGLGSYVAFVVPTLVCHLGICLTWYLMCRRLGSSSWVSLVAVWPLLFFGAGSATFLIESTLALSLPLLLGLLAMWPLLSDSPGRRGVILSVVLLTLGVTVSAGGVVALAFVGAWTLTVHGWRRASVILALPLILFLSWYLAVGRYAPRGTFSGPGLEKLPELAFTLVSTPFGSLVGVPAAGTALLALAAGAAFVVPGVSSHLRALAVAGVFTVVIAAVLFAFASLGSNGDVLVGRYQYVVLAYLVPALAVSLGGLAMGLRAGLADISPIVPMTVAVALLAGVTAIGVQQERDTAQFAAAMGDRAKAWTRGGIAASALGEPMLDPLGGGFTVHGHDLVYLAQAGAATWPALRATPQDRLAAENVFFTAERSQPYGLGRPTEIRSTAFVPTPKPGGGCQKSTIQGWVPWLEFSTFQSAEISVTGPATSVTVTVARDGLQSDPRTWVLTPGQTAYIASGAQLATVRLQFDVGGEYTVCSA